MLTVLPDHDQTIVIFACFPDDKNGILFLDELCTLPDIPLQKAISSILIFYAENTFIAPAVWNHLGDKGQKQLCSEIEMSVSYEFDPHSFPSSQINFFDDKLSAKRLGI